MSFQARLIAHAMIGGLGGSMLNRSRSDRDFAIRLMDHLVVPAFALGVDGRVIIWNRACERLTGLRASDVIGTKEHWRGFYDSPRPCLADLVLNGVSSERLYASLSPVDAIPSALTAENWCVMPRLETRRYLAIDAGPVYSKDGELLAVVETLRDVTPQHEAQLALKSLASLDGLTGLSNRRIFDERLEHECAEVMRGKPPVSLLMLDIDYFKAFNDFLGHQAGDDCLKLVARTIGGLHLRQTDLAARYGGEEFAIILPGSSLPGARLLAGQFRRAVEELAIGHPASPYGVVTLSVGIACTSELDIAEPAELVARADMALYRAKRAGRNRVIDLGGRGDRTSTPSAG